MEEAMQAYHVANAYQAGCRSRREKITVYIPCYKVSDNGGQSAGPADESLPCLFRNMPKISTDLSLAYLGFCPKRFTAQRG